MTWRLSEYLYIYTQILIMVAPTKSKKLKTECTHRCSGQKWKIMGTQESRLCSYPKAIPGSPQKTLIKFPFVEGDIGSQDRKRKWTTPAVGGLFPRASDSAKEANGLPQTSPMRHLGWLRLTEGGERVFQMKTTLDEALPSPSFGEHLVGWIPPILHGLCFQLWNEFSPE